MRTMNIGKKRAIYYLYRLRKEGYVKTKRLKNHKRLYSISIENKLGGKSYEDVINAYSPLKIATSSMHVLYGKEITPEEALIYALQTKSLRIILASLALFKKIKNWKELYRRSKEFHLERKIGALHGLVKNIMRVRKMPKRFKNLTLPQKKEKYVYILQGLKSNDFTDIERLWKVYLPFNKGDVEEYI